MSVLCSHGMWIYSGSPDMELVEGVLSRSSSATVCKDFDGTSAPVWPLNGFKTSLATFSITSYCRACAAVGSRKRSIYGSYIQIGPAG
jgi:hypothetical protein